MGTMGKEQERRGKMGGKEGAVDKEVWEEEVEEEELE